MQGQMTGVGLGLQNDPGKILGTHPGFGSFALLAEAAGKITAIGNLNVDFFKFSHGAL
jgi:hypothetical protein